VFIRRGDKSHICAVTEQMAWLLRQNCNLLVFPEGTTTRGDNLLPFHASLLQPAMLTHSPVQPFSLQYLGSARHHAPFVGDDAFVPHLLRTLALPEIAVKLTFHPPIDTHGKTRNAICRAAEGAIGEELGLNAFLPPQAVAC
jgi:1-acyl-sn-glycerol-3-phosphate acyltransferase